MDIVGYTDRLSAAPGETIAFMVSSSRPSYEAQLVRLWHGDDNPAGPGFKEEELASPLDGRHAGRVQPLRTGSHVCVEGLALRPPFAFQAWVMPTAPEAGPQTLIASGASIRLDGTGALSVRVGGREVSSAVPLPVHEWSFVAVVVDGERARLVQAPARAALLGHGAADVTRPLAGASDDAGGTLVIAGEPDGDGDVREHFNGRIDRPRLFAAALGDAELTALRAGAPPPREALVADWDFSRDISGLDVTDASGHGHHGRVVNLPMRAVTGANWTGEEVDWRRAPEQYGAIHFHDDDLEDAGWEADLHLTVPDTLASGVYALRLRDGDAEDHLPFFVLPPRGAATADVLFLAPTNSYLAYANEHYSWTNEEFAATTTGFGDPLTRLQPQDRFMRDHRLRSIYDAHPDGTGICTSSWRRPLASLRPKFFMQLIRAPHQFNADLHLVDWLAEKGFAHDVATDHDLHAEGVELLRRYRVVLTGSHPEYWTGPMLDALEAYLAGGGRLMYLGGNGFFWVTAIHPEAPHVIEVRRGFSGTRPWSSWPGEVHLAATGEPGGMWRHRGRPPQRLAGVGYTSQGSDAAVPFRRLDDSHDPRAAFIFDGVGEEPIGDGGLVLGGAGGAEVDRYDPALGTPPHALRLATTTGFSDAYQLAIEEINVQAPNQGGTASDRVRADLTFFEGPNDGAVFSTGSIAWCGSLSHDGYDNPVSRITENVLRAFSSAGPLKRDR